MPTAAKLVAAVIFAITGYLTGEAVRDYLPDSVVARQLTLWSIVIPMVCGWRVVGKYIPRGGLTAAINTGVYAMCVAIFFTLTAFAFAEMIGRSMNQRYSGPVDAVVNMFGVALEFGAYLLHPGPIALMVGGAVISGVLGLWAHRKWG